MKQILTLATSLALACSSMESMAAVDLILHNARVYTAEPGEPLQQAIAVENGKVSEVYTRALCRMRSTAAILSIEEQARTSDAARVRICFMGWLFIFVGL